MKEKYAVLTMDVEAFTDTECVSNLQRQIDVDLLDGFDEYIKILDKYGIKGTLFTVGTLAPKIADKLKSCISNGHRIALHSYKHVASMTISAKQFKEDMEKAKRELSELLNTEILGFRAPCFSIDDERLQILKELGFKYDSSHLGFSPARHTVELTLKNFKQIRENIFCNDGFFEFGLSKQKIFGQPFPISGGGYVRLGNWAFIKQLILQYINQSDYYVFYLHPFELTTQKIPILKELKSYDKYYLKANVSSYGRHVEEIIKMLQAAGYKFVTFEQLSEILSKRQATRTM